MGMLKGVEVTLDNLIGYSKLQEVLELLMSTLKEQELVIQPLEATTRALSSQLQATAERLDSQQAAMQAVETRLDSHQAAIEPLQSLQESASSVKAEELQELLGRLETQEDLVQQLRAELTAQSSHTTELTKKVDADCERLAQKVDADCERLAQSAQQRSNAADERMRDIEQQSSDLVAQLHSVDTSLQQLQDALGGVQGVSDLQHSLDNLRQEFEDTKNADKSSMIDELMQAVKRELSKMVNELTATAMAPLETKVAALDAMVSSIVLVRLDDHENRLQCLERIQRDLLDQMSETHPPTQMTAMSVPAGSGTHSCGEASPALLEVKQEISDLSKKLAEVITAFGDHGHDQREAALPPLESGTLEPVLPEADLQAAAEAAMKDTKHHVLAQVSQQLEQRIASLEGKLAISSNQELTEMGDSLKQVQTAAKSLEGIVSKDVQPKLDHHTLEMRRLADEFYQLCRRIEGMATKTSLATTSCLSCHDPRKQGTTAVIIGKDGKAYLQGSGGSPHVNVNIKTDIAWSDVHGSMINGLAKPKLNDRIALQGGSGAPLRKYRIPTGNDGTPTWIGVKSAGSKENSHAHVGAMSRAASAGALDHVRGQSMRQNSPNGPVKANALIVGLPTLRVEQTKIEHAFESGKLRP